jgi:hypothetical protein
VLVAVGQTSAGTVLQIVDADELLPIVVIEGTHINAAPLGIGGTARVGEVEEMISVRQEEGPAVGLNAARAHYPGERSESATGDRNPVQWSPERGPPEHNRAIAIPRASPSKESGKLAPCVPLTCCAAEVERARTQRAVFPSGPRATNANWRPSGETAKL